MRPSDGLRSKLNHAGQDDRKVPFHRGVELVLGLHADGIGRAIAFVIEGGYRLERTVGLKGEEGIVGVPCPADEVVSQGRPGIRIGRVEVTDDGADGLVLGDGEGCGGVEVGGGRVGRSFVDVVNADLHLKRADPDSISHKKFELPTGSAHYHVQVSVRIQISKPRTARCSDIMSVQWIFSRLPLKLRVSRIPSLRKIRTAHGSAHYHVQVSVRIQISSEDCSLLRYQVRTMDFLRRLPLKLQVSRIPLVEKKFELPIEVPTIMSKSPSASKSPSPGLLVAPISSPNNGFSPPVFR